LEGESGKLVNVTGMYGTNLIRVTQLPLYYNLVVW
jgi:hypothetical protein